MKFQFIISTLFLLIFFSCRDEPSIEPEQQTGFSLPPSALAEYEKNINHSGLIDSLDQKAYVRGRQIYNTTCYTCHGDLGQVGSIPTSTKFWSSQFKNGSDPYSMYETLSRGYGLMPPQVQLVPRQKYDVIHFIREEFVKEQNNEQYYHITKQYLDSLPEGTIEGPAATEYKPWAEMDYGNFLINTYELADSTTPPREISGGPSPLPNEDLVDQNFAYKGIAIRLDEGAGGVAAGDAFMMFDADLMRLVGGWTGGFIDYQAILMNERHNIYPRTIGDIHFELPVGPGWANPMTGSFDDPRFKAVDGRRFGPLPYQWAQYKGLYHHEDKVIIKYAVGETTVYESFGLQERDSGPIFERLLNIGPTQNTLKMRVARDDVMVRLSGSPTAKLSNEEGYTVLLIPAGGGVNVKLLITRDGALDIEDMSHADDLVLADYVNGGPQHYSEVLSTQVIKGQNEEAYTADILSLPLTNPWKARIRPTGIDFIPNSDQAVVCTIDGDVWRIDNITSQDGKLEWRRIASGLFQPLGIVYHEGQIFVTCRDQLVLLRDLNEDGETDYYEAFNTDHQVTEHFHEFAMGLQIDQEGHFYYAKSARHARTALIPQHGTLIKVSPDGKTSEIIAKGFRAANGVCLNPDGSFYVTDQEGHWNPMNRINHVTEGGFYGNMYGYGAPSDTSDAAMIQPLCWIDMRYDRSPSELLWVESDQWGPLDGSLLNISYGYGKVFLVLDEEVNGKRQGGMVQLPLPPFPSGLVRGRFHPDDGQMYGCAMTAWATSQVLQAGGLYRIRYTGEELNLPVALKAHSAGISMRFANDLDLTSAHDIDNYTVSTWQLRRTHRYGSKRFDERELPITTVDYHAGQLTLTIPDIEPTWIMEIKYQLKDRSGRDFQGAVQSTIYELGENANQ